METIERDYSPLGVRFFYVYKALAHPELNGYVQPVTLEERLMHVAEAKRTLGSRVEWLADNMDNELKHALGGVPNAEFVVDPDGNVASRRNWSDPRQLRADLEEMVGPVQNPTEASDLDLPNPEFARPTVATGVVPGVQVPGRMLAVMLTPTGSKNDLPYYAKLRVEADPGVIGGGEGTLYVGFHLDPLYEVHWNNLAPQPQFAFTAVPGGVSVNPRAADFPEVAVEADADPREFLVDVDAGGRWREGHDPLELTVTYFACDNANTWCIPLTQTYEIELMVDPDGGNVFDRGGGGFAGRRSRGGRRSTIARDSGADAPTAAGSVDALRQRIMGWDVNEDGIIARPEAPEEQRATIFDLADINGDGVIDAEELEAFLARRGVGR